MQTNLSTTAAAVKGEVTPEIREALRTLKATDFRLEAEYFPFGDWESRLEMAEELRAVLDDLPTDEQADIVAGVVRDLDDETEDFGDWHTRCAAAERLRLVIHNLEPKEVAADVF